MATFELEKLPLTYTHSLSDSSSAYQPFPSHSHYQKYYHYNLVITDKDQFRNFLLVSLTIILAIIALVLILHFLPHKNKHQGTSINFKLAINHALTFYDAQKSGHYPKNSPVKFRGDSGLGDGKSADTDLVGGFYDSGNNIKFTFTTAYTTTLLSWSVMEYHSKYADLGELQHVRDIIRWGSDYLLKVFILPTSTSKSNLTIYSQVGNTISDKGEPKNDISCWQRPEDMDYARPVSICDSSASDLGGEIVAALSASSMVLKNDTEYSKKLVKAAETLHKLVTSEDPKKQGTYTMVDACGKQARDFYKSSSYKDELAWGGTWLFLATGNLTYLDYATETFKSAKSNESDFDNGAFDWNNKLNAVAVLLTRIRYFRDPGGLYEHALRLSSNSTHSLMCSLLFNDFSRTPGGLIIMKDDNGPLLEYAATASFLSKLYSDYLHHLKFSGAKCKSNVNYILGQNPLKMSYLVGYGDKFPVHVHHRSASIPWDDKKHYSCDGGKKWLNSKDPNLQVLVGAMVGGPDMHDGFIDQRNNSRFTEPNIASNAGLVAALIALSDNSSGLKDSF
ncbi:hypothetical protein AHAS_Ahas17G0263800 [Arachis hypogaea]|uniref:Endoglucanase n=1 Tax=Arachis hypogaea TaxID=3818 RepID=A0A445CAN2_ARAHY|nr:hypothetical protein Ahy_A07g033956 [Arachis hypogaea]